MSSFEKHDKEKELRDLLAKEGGAEALKTFEVGSNVGNFEIEDNTEHVLEGQVDEIIAQTKILMKLEFAGMLTPAEQAQVDEIVEQIVETKKRSGMFDLWMSEINRASSEPEKIKAFKENAAKNLFKDIRNEIEGRLVLDGKPH